MSNPQKTWSSRMALGRGVGAAIGAGAAAVLAAAVRLPGSFSIIFYSGLIGAFGGFIGGILGTYVGYRWDEPAKSSDFRGEMLVAMVATGLFAGVTYLVAPIYFTSLPGSCEYSGLQSSMASSGGHFPAQLTPS
jgi:hypothetical protein